MLSNIDRELLQRCLNRSPRGWEDFVDRFLGLGQHIVDHTAHSRSIPVNPAIREELISDIFYAIIKDDFSVLRRFRGQSSLATYLAVVARRVVVKSLLHRKMIGNKERALEPNQVVVSNAPSPNENVESQEEIELALDKLSDDEATAVRMFHLEGKSYRDIGNQIGLAENSIGPYLTRAREKMKATLVSSENAAAPAGSDS